MFFRWYTKKSASLVTINICVWYSRHTYQAIHFVLLSTRGDIQSQKQKQSCV